MKVKISDITIDPNLMPRDGLDDTTVGEYVAAWKRGDVFPPVILIRINERLILADGWHRIESAARAGIARIEATITDGTHNRDVIKAGIGSNSKHGLRPRLQDCRKMVRLIVEDDELNTLSTNKIAIMCGVCWKTVDSIRNELSRKPAEIVYTDSKGTKKTMPSTRPKPDDDDDPFAPTGDEPIPHVAVPAAKPAEGKRDPAGNLIPRPLLDPFCDLMLPGEASRLRQLAGTIDKRAAVNPWIRMASIRDALTAAATAMDDAQPYAVHQPCGGRGCEMCRHCGWLPKWAAEEEATR